MVRVDLLTALQRMLDSRLRRLDYDQPLKGSELVSSDGQTDIKLAEDIFKEMEKHLLALRTEIIAGREEVNESIYKVKITGIDAGVGTEAGAVVNLEIVFEKERDEFQILFYASRGKGKNGENLSGDGDSFRGETGFFKGNFFTEDGNLKDDFSRQLRDLIEGVVLLKIGVLETSACERRRRERR